jgi:PEP-CTERM motif
MWEHVDGDRTRNFAGPVNLPGIGINAPFHFRVTDDGTNIAFSAWLDSDPATVFTLQGTSNYRSPGGENYVAFYNRESYRTIDDTVIMLDNISIVPEPATVLSAAIGAAIAGVVMWQRRRWRR